MHSKRCVVCGDLYVKPRTVTLTEWAKRRFCSRACLGISRRGVLPETATEALLRRGERYSPTGCLNWTGPLTTEGYGRITFANRQHTVHRLAYEIWVGEIPEGQGVLHRCDNRRCFERQHLFVGTNEDNTADRNAKGRQARGEGHARAKLTESDVRSIRASAERIVDLAAQYGVGETAISNIRSHRSWAHVTD